MNFKDYQEKAWSFTVPTARNEKYILNGFVGEVGEFYGKIAKETRDGSAQTVDEFESKLKKELGDILWFVAGLATLYGWDLNDIAEGNIKKLEARKAVFTIQGSGDDR